MHFFGEKVIVLQPFFDWHALDSDQRFGVRIVAPEASHEACNDFAQFCLLLRLACSPFHASEATTASQQTVFT